MFERSLREFQERIGIEFRDQALLRRVFTRGAVWNFDKGEENNKNLERLGDAILKRFLKEWWEKNPEKLYLHSNLQNLLESNAVIGRIAFETGMISCLRLPRPGAHAQNQESKLQLIGSTVEAFIAALEKEQGGEIVRNFLNAHLLNDEFVKEKLFRLFDSRVSMEQKKAILREMATPREVTFRDHQRGSYYHVSISLQGDAPVGVNTGDMDSATSLAMMQFLGKYRWLLLGHQGESSLLFPLAVGKSLNRPMSSAKRQAETVPETPSKKHLEEDGWRELPIDEKTFHPKSWIGKLIAHANIGNVRVIFRESPIHDKSKPQRIALFLGEDHLITMDTTDLNEISKQALRRLGAE